MVEDQSCSDSNKMHLGEDYENARASAAAAATAAAARANEAVERLRRSGSGNSIGKGGKGGSGDPCEVLVVNGPRGQDSGGRLISVDLWSSSQLSEYERVRATIEAELPSEKSVEIVDALGTPVTCNTDILKALISRERMPLRAVTRAEVGSRGTQGAVDAGATGVQPDPFTEVLGERLAAIELTAESAAKCANHCSEELQRVGLHNAATRLATLEQRVELIMSEVTHEKNIRENVIGTFAKRLDTVVQLVERVIGDTTMRVSEQVLPVLALPVKEEELENEAQSDQSPTSPSVQPDTAGTKSPVTTTARSEEFLFAQTQAGSAKDAETSPIEASVRRLETELSSQVQRLDDRLDILAISRASDSKRLEEQGIQLHSYADEMKSQGECVTSAIEAVLQWLGEYESSGFQAALERLASHYADGSRNVTPEEPNAMASAIKECLDNAAMVGALRERLDNTATAGAVRERLDNAATVGAIRERLDNAASLGAVRDRLEGGSMASSVCASPQGSSSFVAPSGISRMSSIAGAPGTSAGLSGLVAEAQERIKRYTSGGSAPSVVDLPRGRPPLTCMISTPGGAGAGGASVTSSAPTVQTVEPARGGRLTPASPATSSQTVLSPPVPTAYGGVYAKPTPVMPTFGMTQASSGTPVVLSPTSGATEPPYVSPGGFSPRSLSVDTRTLSQGPIVRGRQLDTRRVQSSSPIAERRSMGVTRTNQYSMPQGAVSITQSPGVINRQVLGGQSANRTQSPQPGPVSISAPTQAQTLLHRPRATTYGTPASIGATAGTAQVRGSPATSLSATGGAPRLGSLSPTSSGAAPAEGSAAPLPKGHYAVPGGRTPPASSPGAPRSAVEANGGAAHERATLRPFRRLVSHSIGLSPD